MTQAHINFPAVCNRLREAFEVLVEHDGDGVRMAQLAMSRLIKVARSLDEATLNEDDIALIYMASMMAEMGEVISVMLEQQLARSEASCATVH